MGGSRGTTFEGVGLCEMCSDDSASHVDYALKKMHCKMLKHVDRVQAPISDVGFKWKRDWIAFWEG